MSTTLIIILAAIWIVCLYCFFKEKNITGMYKVSGIYGRIYAYFAVNLAVGGVAFLGAIFTGETNTGTDIVTGAVALGVSVFLYWRVYSKSPDFLKKRCLRDLTISGFGATLRVTLWFMRIFVSTWWAVSAPDEYELDNGMKVFVFPDGMVYDANLGRFGKASENRESVIWE